ncbi:hypothetical protein ACJX0J_009171 [Zea mays]
MPHHIIALLFLRKYDICTCLISTITQIQHLCSLCDVSVYIINLYACHVFFTPRTSSPSKAVYGDLFVVLHLQDEFIEQQLDARKYFPFVMLSTCRSEKKQKRKRPLIDMCYLNYNYY